MNSKYPIYGSNVLDTPIFKGAFFQLVEPLSENVKSCSDFWHGLTKSVTKMAFGAEIR